MAIFYWLKQVTFAALALHCVVGKLFLYFLNLSRAVHKKDRMTVCRKSR
ncbi:MAG: hypothetical protein ACR5K7_02795 [Symbiopectobacterium sp.]